MIVIIQYPLSDMRQFLGASAEKLSRPSWPVANASGDFVRSFGPVRVRKRGGVEQWPGEDIFGEAKSALQFPDCLSIYPIGSAAFSARAVTSFRRLYSDGATTRVEVGLGMWIEKAAIREAKLADWRELLLSALSMQVFVPGGHVHSRAVRLVGAAPALAEHYLRSTTKRPSSQLLESPSWWVTPGAPAIFIHSHPLQPMPAFPHSTLVVEREGIGRLFHTWIQMGSARCSTWWLTPEGKSKDERRRLRLHVMRLHAERECLRVVLQSIGDGKFNIEKDVEVSNSLQEYLNLSIRALEKNERFGVEQSAMLDVARHALGVAFSGQTASFQFMRRQILAKVERYIRASESRATVVNNFQGGQMNTSINMGNVSVGGDFNAITAENITNSFNKAAASEANADMKEALKNLALQVAELAKALPQEKAESVSRDLNTFTGEAVSKQPRQQWYELSANGLLEAAKSVTSLAAPVTTAVKAVLALIAP